MRRSWGVVQESFGAIKSLVPRIRLSFGVQFLLSLIFQS